jgi:hypothetical protein
LAGVGFAVAEGVRLADCECPVGGELGEEAGEDDEQPASIKPRPAAPAKRCLRLTQ